MDDSKVTQPDLPKQEKESKAQVIFDRLCECRDSGNIAGFMQATIDAFRLIAKSEEQLHGDMEKLRQDMPMDHIPIGSSGNANAPE